MYKKKRQYLIFRLQTKTKVAKILTCQQMIPQRSSEHQTDDNQRISFIRQMYHLRSKNDRLRKQLSNNLQLVFTTLRQSSNQDQILKHEKQISCFFSEEYTDKLVNALTFCYYQTQHAIIESKQVQKEEIQSLEVKKRELETIRHTIRTKQNTTLLTRESIQTKNAQLEILDEKLQELLGQYLQCRINLLQKEQKQKSYNQTVVQNNLTQNWDKQKQYILSLIQQRVQIRKRIFMMQKAHQLLDQKIVDYQKLLEQFSQNKQRNTFLSEQNKNISRNLHEQKHRKEQLEDSKMIQVLKKQVSLSADIVQKWDEEKRLAENTLLSIIEKVNNKLPFKKLEDVTEIVKAAERFYSVPKDSQRIFEQQEGRMVQNEDNSR